MNPEENSDDILWFWTFQRQQVMWTLENVSGWPEIQKAYTMSVAKVVAVRMKYSGWSEGVEEK
jgi:hypothetical protein